MEVSSNRRSLKTRSTRWAGTLAQWLVRCGFSPNVISLTGIAFAAAGAIALVLAPERPWSWLVGAVLIQLRLLANMLDGMVAIEGGKSTATGALFNEVPDRIEDTLLLVAAGYAADQPAFGWLLALLAMASAYIRLLGGSLGQTQHFCGPMAKQHRMALLTIGAALSTFVPLMGITLIIILVGTVITCVRRLLRIAKALREVKA